MPKVAPERPGEGAGAFASPLGMLTRADRAASAAATGLQRRRGRAAQVLALAHVAPSAAARQAVAALRACAGAGYKHVLTHRAWPEPSSSDSQKLLPNSSTGAHSPRPVQLGQTWVAASQTKPVGQAALVWWGTQGQVPCAAWLMHYPAAAPLKWS